MFKFKQKLLALVVGCFLVGGLSTGVFAPRREGDKRPPKDDNRVVVRQKDQKPPQNTNNRGNKGRDDKKGKP